MISVSNTETPSHCYLPKYDVICDIGELKRLHNEALSRIEELQTYITQTQSRLAQIDPHLVGNKRTSCKIKYFFLRLMHRKTIKTLQNTCAKNQTLLANIEKEKEKLETQMKFCQEQLELSQHTAQKTFLNRSATLLVECGKRWMDTVRCYFSRSTNTAPLPEAVACVPTPVETSTHPFVQSARETNKDCLLKFLRKMPVFETNPELFEQIDRLVTLPDTLRITQIEPDSLKIDSPEKLRSAINLEMPITAEECQALDPTNPLLSKEGHSFTVRDLQQFGSIDSSWWGWLKERPLPEFGPQIILQREANTLKFQKGTSLSYLQLNPESISAKAFFITKTFPWKVEDLFLFATKLKKI